MAISVLLDHFWILTAFSSAVFSLNKKWDPINLRVVHALTGRFSMSFGREVATLTGALDRADWKNANLIRSRMSPVLAFVGIAVTQIVQG
jgi:hypothetical protein